MPNRFHRKKSNRPLIMWGIPCDELMFTKFFIQFVKNAGFLPEDTFALSEGTYLPKARNMIHNAFLEGKQEYLMMVDSDILVHPNIVNILWKHQLPIVGGWYHDKVGKNPCVYDFIKQGEDGVNYFKHRDVKGQGLEKVDAIGAGCMLMSRDVAEKLGESPYDMNSGGEDMVLCKKLMDLNIPLHVDWDVACAHTGVFYI